MNLLILGPQASGKGTQAKRIAKELGIPHISTGDIFRDNIERGTDLGKKVLMIQGGELVPDELTNSIVKNRLKQEDCANGYILDGYPRNLVQAEYLNSISQIDAVIDLEVPTKVIMERITSRRACGDCKADYNIIYMKPKQEGICDKCEGELIQRKDDTPGPIKKRLDIYYSQTQPLISFYKEQGVSLKEIDGVGTPGEILDRIMNVLR
jgi:adenylate kinase